MSAGTSFLEKIESLTLDRLRGCRLEEPEARLRQRALQARYPFPFVSRLMAAPPFRIIAEVKRMSPSQGAIAMDMSPCEVALEYAGAGAAGVSVLTEPTHFGGRIEDLAAVRLAVPHLPLLMKDFVIDPYQLYQARAYGADAVLLVHALLGPKRLRELHALASEIGLTTLVEVHDETELVDAISSGATLIGVNNRNLKTLAVSLGVSATLARQPAPGVVLVSESGIETRAHLSELGALGYQAFLVGTSLLRHRRPGDALRSLRRAEASS